MVDNIFRQQNKTRLNGSKKIIDPHLNPKRSEIEIGTGKDLFHMNIPLVTYTYQKRNDI